MKKLLLAGAVLIGASSLNAQTITHEDLKWNVGNEWRTEVFPMDTNLLTKTGTGVNWDFTTLTGGTIDTIKVTASATADIAITSNSIADVDYKSITNNFSLAAITGFNADDASTMHIGLPHTAGQTWTSSATAAGGFITLNMAGSVPASGTVTVPWGTFDCLLVREKITGTINQTNLFWETAEHGRVAIFSGGKLSVMQSTNFTTSVETAGAASDLSVFPNPATDQISVTSSATAATIKLFDALGNQVKSVAHNGGTQSITVADLAAGLYVVQVSSAAGIETKSVVVK